MVDEGQSSAASVTDQDVEIARAILVPAVSTMIVDGEIHHRETAQLANICGFSQVFAPIGPDDTSQLSMDIIDEIKKDGHATVIERAAQSLSPALRETALCFAIRIALADGRLDEREKQAIKMTVQIFDISDDIATKIFDVLTMMQRTNRA